MTNNTIEFVKAERSRAKARIALCGPSGSGKTHSALRIAEGLAKTGKIALIDTENSSAEMEAGKPGIPPFDVVVMHAPFDPIKYNAAIRAAEAAGYEVLIIDSLSHAWAGSGGLLEKKDILEKIKKNSFTAWREITPIHNKLIETILQTNMHIIATIRTKTGMAVDTDSNGKISVKKIGMDMVQRDGIDYEFTVVLDLDQATHVASPSKDRTSIFDTPDGKNMVVPTKEVGLEISDWLEGAKPEKTKLPNGVRSRVTAPVARQPVHA